MAAPTVTQIGSAQNKTAGAFIDVPLTAGAAVGDTVVAIFAMDPISTATITVTDTGGNSYTQQTSVVQGSAANGVRTVVLTAPVTTALSSGNNIRITHTSVTSRAASSTAFPSTGALRRSGSARRSTAWAPACIRRSPHPTALASCTDKPTSLRRSRPGCSARRPLAGRSSPIRRASIRSRR